MAQLQQTLRTLSIDPNESFRVRDVHLSRGDVSFYLNEGLVMFAHPVDGRGIAAVFTTAGSEGGDGEVIVMPSQTAERASLASFTGTPNLDEHFDFALFFFGDQTREQILSQLHSPEEHKDVDVVGSLQPRADSILRYQAAKLETLLVRQLLDAHKPSDGLFASVIVGRHSGPFQVLYEPENFEPVAIGRTVENPAGQGHSFQLWTSYRPRQMPPYRLPSPALSNYSIRAVLDQNLRMTASARFSYRSGANDGRVISLNLSPLLALESASVNGEPVEIEESEVTPSVGGDRPVLLVCAQPLQEGSLYQVEVAFSGDLIKRVGQDSYLVQDRNLWYPHTLPMRTTFDLEFQCPEEYRLVSTGEPIEEHVDNHVRFVHRRTAVPEQIAGFNIGHYTSAGMGEGPYHIEAYADPSARNLGSILKQAAGIVTLYSKQWSFLPLQSLSITPVPGYFGQGFPGLIYLSNVSYMREKKRPLELRSQSTDVFFSQYLLAHEIAHQWWGNLVAAADYRTGWLMEAMAGYSALQRLEEQDGKQVLNETLDEYREHLLGSENGKTLDSVGPVDFGVRLLESGDERAWHAIVYEKGAWILHMLRERIGDAGFRQLQLAMLREFTDKPISNDDFRKLASRYVPPKDGDRTLEKFFETWVYATGLPALRLKQSGGTATVVASGVDESFSVRVPLQCRERDGRNATRWETMVSGENSIAVKAGEHCSLPSPETFLYVPQ